MNQLRSQSPLDRSRRTRSVTEMRTATLTGFLVFAASAACSFDPSANREEDASTADVDAVVPDAIPVDCEPDTIVCDDAAERYVECDSNGAAAVVIDCPLGCYELAEKCVDVAPSNGLAGYLDLARDDASVTDIVFTGSSTINTDTGEVSIGGVVTALPTDVANGIRVYMFKSLEIPGTLKVTGAIPLAFVSHGDATITGTLDVSADSTMRGPGGVDVGACVGSGTSNIASNPIPGGGGGGRFQAGAAGGAGYNGPAGQAGGEVNSDPDLQPLVGGCRGGTAAYLIFPTPPPNGGGGGGAVQITSRTRVEIVSTGKIDASGGGGTGPGPGPGGGSGGGILLEAPTVVIDGAGAVISTKGGAGGGTRGSGTSAAPGEDGGTGPAAANGGSLGGNYAAGGNGGTEGAPPTAGGAGNSTNIHGAGGGGSVGEARFNTETATVVPANGAAIRSRFSVGTIGTRLVP